jgi:hypothetical protein
MGRREYNIISQPTFKGLTRKKVLEYYQETYSSQTIGISKFGSFEKICIVSHGPSKPETIIFPESNTIIISWLLSK